MWGSHLGKFIGVREHQPQGDGIDDSDGCSDATV